MPRLIKGRGAGRKPNDVLVKLGNHVARLRRDLTEPKRVDRTGLWIDCTIVKGASSRALRRQLEDQESGVIHLCRGQKCRIRDGEIHCKECAALDPEAIVDIGAHAQLTPPAVESS